MIHKGRVICRFFAPLIVPLAYGIDDTEQIMPRSGQTIIGEQKAKLNR
jgi:hypothetical protein